MAKVPKSISVHWRMWASIRRNPIKSVAAILGVLGAYPAGMAGAKLISDQIEPSWLASHEWVREQIDQRARPITLAQQTTNSILRDLQIESAEGKRSAAANAAANWKLEKLKTKDSVTQGLIDQQIHNQEIEVDRLDDQLKTLKTLKAKGQ